MSIRRFHRTKRKAELPPPAEFRQLSGLSDIEWEQSRAFAEHLARAYAADELREKLEADRIVPPAAIAEVTSDNVETILSGMADGIEDDDTRKAFRNILHTLQEGLKRLDQLFGPRPPSIALH